MSHVLALQVPKASVPPEYLGPSDVPEPLSTALESMLANTAESHDQAAASFLLKNLKA